MGTVLPRPGGAGGIRLSQLEEETLNSGLRVFPRPPGDGGLAFAIARSASMSLRHRKIAARQVGVGIVGKREINPGLQEIIQSRFADRWV